MINRVFIPKTGPLEPLINCIGYVELENNDINDCWMGLLPNASSNLTISLTSDHIQYNAAVSDAILFSACDQAMAIRKTSKLKFINVQFSPIGLYCFFKIPLDLLSFRLGLDELIGQSQANEILEKLNTAGSPENCLASMARFLEERLIHSLPDQRVLAGIKKMQSEPNVDLNNLSYELNLSGRRFRKIFDEWTGFSPSYFKKIMRFRSSFAQIERGQYNKLTDVALINNYYDQSHFIKDFKYFSGLTPQQFIRTKSSRSDFYNFLLADITMFDQYRKNS